jgi:POT family proton-dependent oligopeptide transporter
MNDSKLNRTWMGHPVSLSTLFFTELWERFSYYGMRALLVLFMVDEVQKGGMGLDDEMATSIYGLYTAFVYLACLPGGWIADRLLGARKAVWIGGLIIASGHFALAIPNQSAFFLGLLLVIIGTGFLKPNVSAMVGQLYPEGGARRDAGFTLFYMGINMGAFLGPLVCSYLGENVNWHIGFGAAGVGMLLWRHSILGDGSSIRKCWLAGNSSKDSKASGSPEWIQPGILLLVFLLY